MSAKMAWSNLKTGDRIVCPGDGRTERVVRVERRRDGSTFVRTSRHDHFRPKHARVERIEQ